MIKVSDKIREWRWYTDSHTKAVYIDLLLSASECECDIGRLSLQRGEAIVTYAAISERTGLSIRTIRTAFANLVATGDIEVTRLSKGLYVTVVDFDRYAISDTVTQGVPEPPQEVVSKETVSKKTNDNQTTITRQSPDNHPTITRQSSDNQATSTKKEKPLEKESTKERDYPKRKKLYIYNTGKKSPEAAVAVADTVSDSDLQQAIEDFKAMRKQIKKPMTERAEKLMLSKLEKLSGGDVKLKVQILEQSITHDWLDIYPLHEDDTKRGKKQIRPPKGVYKSDDTSFSLTDTSELDALLDSIQGGR